MMKLESKQFGNITIEEKQVIQFPSGLLGFEEFSEFALIEDYADNPFKWLQSTLRKDLAFIVIQPELFLAEYKPSVPKNELLDIELNSLEDGILFVIVTIPEDPHNMTANLQGPVIINPKKSLGRQFISRNESHSVRAKIIQPQAAGAV